ncbi:MAG: hypothetical protein HY290_13550 [Planctomycetia bacterium]|nr:hypothetical protein [Planctomycetia bacterium]
MNARLMAACTICALALAAFCMSPQISAQPGGGGARGIFSSLKVGQMVEYRNDAWGSPVLTTYEDEETRVLMRHKVREIGADYVALEFEDREGTGAVVESRISAYRLSILAHVGKTTRKPTKSVPAAGDPLSDKPTDKSTKPGTKPGTTPKKKT